MSGQELLQAIDRWVDLGEALLQEAKDAECELTAECLEDAVKVLNNNWVPVRREVLRNV